MGKYMRKAKAAGEVALMELVQSSLGVRTRARTLALQRLQKSASAAASSSGASYLQLRNRRLEKPAMLVAGDSKRQKQSPKGTAVENANLSSNSRMGSGLKVGASNSASAASVSTDCLNREAIDVETEKMEVKEREVEEENNVDESGVEASFGENVLEIEGRERSARESTPCSLIRDPEGIRTPGSTTRPTFPTESNRRLQNSMQRQMPMACEIDEFFARAEEKQHRQFIQKYNFDPVTDEPLPGRYEWVKLDPQGSRNC